MKILEIIGITIIGFSIFANLKYFIKLKIKQKVNRKLNPVNTTEEFESVKLLKSYLENATPDQLKEDWESINH